MAELAGFLRLNTSDMTYEMVNGLSTVTQLKLSSEVVYKYCMLLRKCVVSVVICITWLTPKRCSHIRTFFKPVNFNSLVGYNPVKYPGAVAATECSQLFKGSL